MEREDHKILGSLTVESLYPLVVGSIAAAVALVVCGRGSVDYLPQGENMLASLVGLGGIVAGFLATMKTLLLGMSEDTIDRLISSGYMPILKSYLSEALRAALCLCVLSVAGFAPRMGEDNPLYLSALMGFLAYSLAALFRVTRVGMALLMRR